MTRKSGNQKRTTCPRRITVIFFSLIIVFLNLHPSPGSPSTVLGHHFNFRTILPFAASGRASERELTAPTMLNAFPFLSWGWRRVSWTSVLAKSWWGKHGKFTIFWLLLWAWAWGGSVCSLIQPSQQHCVLIIISSILQLRKLSFREG